MRCDICDAWPVDVTGPYNLVQLERPRSDDGWFRSAGKWGSNEKYYADQQPETGNQWIRRLRGREGEPAPAEWQPALQLTGFTLCNRCRADLGRLHYGRRMNLEGGA